MEYFSSSGGQQKYWQQTEDWSRAATKDLTLRKRKLFLWTAIKGLEFVIIEPAVLSKTDLCLMISRDVRFDRAEPQLCSSD